MLVLFFAPFAVFASFVMPRLPSLRVAVLAQLAEELRYAPAAAARRHVERAEALLDEVRDEQAYPQDFVAFAITGYRPEATEAALIPGAALRADLAPLIERLSDAARYTSAELKGSWLSPAQVCARWKVSKATLDRYRRRGLPGRRVMGARGRVRVLFDARRVEAFLAAHGAALARAAGFSRIDPELLDRLVRRAGRYQRVLGWSVSRIAQRLGERFARSPGAIAGALARGGFDPRALKAPAIGARQRRVIERAVRLGVSMRAISRSLGKPPASVHRAFWLRRGELLRGAFTKEGAGGAGGAGGAEPDRALSRLVVAPTLTGLGRPGAEHVLEHLRQTLAEGWPDAGLERARLRALHELRTLARAGLARVHRLWPEAALLDGVQTHLLWAARVLAELVRSQQMMVLKSIEARFGREAGEVPGPLLAEAITLCAPRIAEAALNMDTGRSAGRLAAPAGLLVNKALARLQTGEERSGGGFGAGAPSGSERAHAKARRLEPRGDSPRALDQIALPDWTRRVALWQTWLEPPAWVRAFITAGPSSDERAREVLAHRFGYPPAPRPMTSAEVAARRALTGVQCARLERRSLEQARAWAWARFSAGGS